MHRIRISNSKRHFTTNGSPFFWLADTAWELFHKLSLPDADYYLNARALQGFNVVQAVVLAELDGIHSPNANGDTPLHNQDPAQPDEKYFSHVDDIIRLAASKNIYIALLPTWGDKVNKRYEWATGPEIFNEKNAYRYTNWLALRYKNENNIVWILGGDRNPDEREEHIWRTMAQGIKDAAPDAVISFHPQPFGSKSSSAWFHNEGWLSFNMLQTGHDRYVPVNTLVDADYARIPVKPVLNGEPVYEMHPVSFNVTKGYSTDGDVRRDAYLSVFAGACGHTYGSHSTWQFYTKKEQGINHPLMEWKDAMQLAGAGQMKYLYRLMMSRDLLKRIPGNDLLVNYDADNIKDCIIAARANDGSYAFIYTATGKTIVINTQVLSGTCLQWYWMSPKDGTATIPQTVKKEPILTFTPPHSGEGCDWVLIVDALM